jgi:phenylalanyl-tRNA synthetase beta chain
MRVPLSWLGEFVELDADITAEQAHADLVSVGFEEEDVHGFDVTGPVVVGQVLEQIPEEQSNGKTINWCQVRVAPEGQLAADGGADVRGIVCGAHNFGPGDKVVVTLPGAVLPGGFAIAARKTYGHVSDGMIASARELSLGDDHDGIIVLSRLGLDPEVGTDAKTLLGLDQVAVEINVTPDRGYAFSLRGVAREYALATGRAFTDPASQVTIATPSGFAFALADNAPIRGRNGASVFVTRLVRGVDAKRPTPAWMVARLQLAGIRSISLAVDITNYVMLELGNPIHGYDFDKLSGGITVRRANAGETLTTLDGKERTLNAEDLLITDDSGAIGLAGVMGGASTEMSLDTTNILVEAAIFDPVSIARTARRHKLPSEASKRFERGVDPEVSRAAAQRVVDLLVELGGGVADALGSEYLHADAPVALTLARTAPSALIGITYTDTEVVSALEAIGATVVDSGDHWLVTPPTWRPDLSFEAALIEEIARIVGYDRIPSIVPVAPPGRGYTREQRLRRRAANALAASLVEVQNYPFVGEAENALFGAAVSGEQVRSVRIANPLDAQVPLLRRSLIPGLIGAASRNVSRGFTNLALFETGSVFVPTDSGQMGTDFVPPLAARPASGVLAELNSSLPAQPRHIAALFVGDAVAKQPGEAAREYDWADALDAVRTIAESVAAEVEIRHGAHQAFHPGRTAEILVTINDERMSVGFAGELLPEIVAEAHLPGRVALAEVNLDLLVEAGRRETKYRNISTHPAATQDLSLLLNVDVPAGDVLALLRASCGDLLEDVTLVDDYRGPGVADGQRSLTFALRFRADDRTLTAAEASEAKMAGVAAAENAFGAQIRD